MDIIDMPPGDLAWELAKLADSYSKAGEMRIALIRKHALFFQINRPNYKSDAGLEHAFELTEEGLAYIEINQKLKNIEKKMSAIKSLLQVREGERRNQW
jgi:hypothetical protein